MSQNATFRNFSSEPFTGYWNGKPKTFKASEEVFMPSWLAEHFAKHLTNRELIKVGKDSYTSPKKPADVPEFMELFNKAFIAAEDEGDGGELDGIIASARVDEPSSNIEVKPTTRIDQGPASASRATADEFLPTDHEVGPGSGSTVIGEANDEDDEYDVQEPAQASTAPVATAPSIPVGPAPQA